MRLIVARCVAEEPPQQTSSLYAPIIPTHQLDEHLHTIHTMMTALSNPSAVGPQDQQVIHTMNPEFFAQLQQVNVKEVVVVLRSAALHMFISNQCKDVSLVCLLGVSVCVATCLCSK